MPADRAAAAERPHLGQSKNVKIDARSITFFANGNNIIVVGDFCRRVVRSRLDPRMERPELREFKGNPEDMVLADRGKYIAACLTICRAYIAAGRPNRAATGVVWRVVGHGALGAGVARRGRSGEVDGPVEGRRSRDGRAAHHAERVEGQVWGRIKECNTLRDVINICDANKATPDGKEYINKGLRDAVLAVMPVQHHLKPDATALGNWLRSRKERRVGKLRFRKQDATGSRRPCGGLRKGEASPAVWRSG